jgi:hypothetical protein
LTRHVESWMYPPPLDIWFSVSWEVYSSQLLILKVAPPLKRKMLNTGLGIWSLDQRVAVTRHKMLIMFNDYGDGSNNSFIKKTSICVIL